MKNQGSSPLKFGPMSMAAGALPGLVKFAGGLIGNRKRKNELKRAQGAYDMQRQRYENLDTSNPYANMENMYEDATVSTQAADFAKAQSMQSQSNIMDQLGGAAGGSGIAALAQAMSNQAGQQANRASVSIGNQEQANQAAERQAASNIQSQEREGEMMSRKMEAQKVKGLMNFAGQDLQAATAAKAAGESAMMSGIGSVIGSAGNLLPS